MVLLELMEDCSVNKAVKETVSKYLPKGYQVFVFGSRAKGQARRWSDVDVGILGGERVPLSALGLINEELENSDIPFKVDVVDFSRVSKGFREEALKEATYL